MDVAILGCGYVGLELGRQLRAAGHRAIGVRRSADGLEAIEDAGFEAVRADVTDPDDLSGVPDADAVVFAASTGGRASDATAREIYVDGLRTAIEAFGTRAEPPDRFVYTSSTGVYGDHGGDWVNEETPLDPATDRTEVLVEAERIALEAPSEYGMDGTVARLAGLYGPGRTRIERYLEGPVTEGYLNVVHRDDAAGAIRFLLADGHARGEVVLVADDEPVSKWEFADWLADEFGVERPPKRTTEERLSEGNLSERGRRRILTSKRCSNAKLTELGYQFSYPTFLTGYRPEIDARRAETRRSPR